MKIFYVATVLTRLTFIAEVTGSNLGPENRNIIFHFSISYQTDAGMS